MRIFSLFVIGATLCFGVLQMSSVDAASNEAFQFINGFRLFPTSFDPIESDWNGNQDLARMVYLTPIELSADDRLTSTLLEKYEFVAGEKEIRFVLRDGLKYSDGTPIVAEDLAFAISRVAFTLENFPIVSDIVGLAEWKKQKTPLKSFPKGIVVLGKTVTLKLTKPPRHPLFRFLAPQFSVIPRSFVDTEKNALTNPRPPTSGFYEVKSMKAPDVVLELRQSGIPKGSAKMPQTVVMRYATPEEIEPLIAKGLPQKTVVMTSNSKHTPDSYAKMKSNTEFRFLQSTDIGILLLNPKAPAFKDAHCRKKFAEEYRRKLQASSLGKFGVEASAFTKVLPGYLAHEDIKSRANTSKGDKCENFDSSAAVRWFKRPWGSGENIYTVLDGTIQSLGLKGTMVENLPDGPLKAFSEGTIDTMFLFTGFWATDTAGDLKMLFTPDLWYPGFLHNLTHDAKVRAMLDTLEKEEDAVKRKAIFEEINVYLYQDATMNIFAHPKLFFMYSKNNKLMPPPVGMMEPTPWQLFHL